MGGIIKMISLNTNLSSIIACGSLTKSTSSLNQAIERMSTGLKINHASDNAANYSISTNMSTRLGAYQVAEDNASMGLDLLTTASDSLTQISNKLVRLRALATQTNNGTYGEKSKDSINSEANALVDEINRLYKTTSYNGINLFESTEDETSLFVNEIVERDTAAMTKLSEVDSTQTLSTGTYSISTVEELKKLSEMTNSGLLTADSEFVLANDIDLSGVIDWIPIGTQANNFIGTFDGNGHVISNLSIYDIGNTKGSNHCLSIFGWVKNTEIKNLGVENFCVEAGNTSDITSISPLVSALNISGTLSVENSYTTGNVNVTDASRVDYAGFLATASFSSSIIIKDCYSSVDVAVNNASATVYSGGAAGFLTPLTGEVNVTNVKIEGSYKVQSSAEVYNSGLVGCLGTRGHNFTIMNSYVDSFLESTGSTVYEGVFVGMNSTMSLVIDETTYGDKCENVDAISALSAYQPSILNISKAQNDSTKFPVSINFQIGISSSGTSTINIDTSFTLDNIESLRGIGKDNTDYLALIDTMLENINSKQIEFGSVQNRLDSVIESLSINIDNLTSSLSTIRDADIAEVSSIYIQQQILQQASATLLATANQSPAIALQLL